MNDRNASAVPERQGAGGDGDDRKAIARLLPAPPSWDLPPDRHARGKDLLMHQIDHDRTTRTRPVGRRLLRPALLAPVSALALAGALTAGIALSGDDKAAGTASHRAATDMRPAAALLGRISDAAGKQHSPAVRDDQFVYTRKKVREADLTSGKAVVSPLKEYETWVSQEPGPLRKLGLMRSGDGETLPINAELGDTEGTPAGMSRPTYRWLASLPTDPDELLDQLYAQTPAARGRERDQAVFEQIGSLLGGMTPPRTAAALYRAAAKIPGVTEAPGARDAIGRRGLGIAREDTRHGVHTEWVFDKEDYSFLGSRSRLTKDMPYGAAGTLLSSSAELRHAAVDEAGRRPTGSTDGGMP
ncbi:MULTISPECIES: CU044_5270 family protein [Streptomyces]|uniref:CU044_5270 family protein n=1 Tax=Streptomyces TaxID=1883 RepID=UPI001E3CB940|nr:MULTISPECIES: CU044_5270 family protein [Streptomyces]UFQ17826.1 CU044_5270 family protein [Streptomyces huasconensis]WCL87432.1 CU044_5270 family protein [Streptomyces sp. JCM 35825]